MSRKQEPAPRLSDHRTQFFAALNNYTSAATMLASVVSSVVRIDGDIPEGQRMNPSMLKKLQEALAQFDAAR